MSSAEESESSAKPSSEIPDLYRMLSLEPLESDSEKIQNRIDRLQRKAQQLGETNPRKAKQAVKLAKVATTQLLSPKKKAAYDAAWKSTFGELPSSEDSVATQNRDSGRLTAEPLTTGKSIAESQPAPEPLSKAWSDFEALLPSGSHADAFDMSAYLESAQTNYDDAELDRLLESLTAQANGNATDPLRQPTTALQSVASPPAFTPNSTPTNNQLARSLKSRRRRNWLGPLIGLFACLAMVMGLIAFLVRPGTLGTKDSESEEQIAAAKRTNAASEGPRRSGLPPVGGFGDLGDTGAQITLTPAEQMEDTPDVLATPPARMRGMMNDAANEPARPDSTPSAPPSDTPQNGNSPINMASSGIPAPQMASALAGIGSLAAEYDYEATRIKISELEAQPLDKEQRSQVQRTAKLVDLAAEAHAALIEHVSSMQAGETFLVGSSAQIAFVEADQQELAIRLRGGTRKYEYGQLPPGILYTLLDLSLDRMNARALAARGAFIALQPNRTSRSLSKAREYLVQAETGDDSLVGLSSIIEVVTASE